MSGMIYKDDFKMKFEQAVGEHETDVFYLDDMALRKEKQGEEKLSSDDGSRDEAVMEITTKRDGDKSKSGSQKSSLGNLSYLEGLLIDEQPGEKSTAGKRKTVQGEMMTRSIDDFLDYEHDSLSAAGIKQEAPRSNAEQNRDRNLVVAALKKEEYVRLLQREREKLVAEIREKLYREESGAFRDMVRDDIKKEIRVQIVDKEFDSMYRSIREDIVEEIRTEINKKDYKPLFDKEMKKLKQQVYSEILSRDIDQIRENTLDAIKTEERERIKREQRGEIIARERARIEKEVAPGIKKSIRENIYREELEQYRKSNNRELIERIKATLEETISTNNIALIAERIPEIEREMYSQVSAEMKEQIKESCVDLIGEINEILKNLDDKQVNDSLWRTTEFLNKGLQSYDSFSLNNMHTQRLHLYLKQLHRRFQTQFDVNSESVKRIVKKLNYILSVVQ
jgi:hypothetical protein